MKITLNDNGKPCIKFRHNDKSKSNDDLLIGLFVKEAMQNGLKISSPNGYLNTTTGESFENYVIEPINKEAVDNVIKILCKQNDDKDLRIKELESEVSLLKITNQVQADLFNGKLKDIITVAPTITKQDIIEVIHPRVKTGLADDEQPEPIEENNLCHLCCPNSCDKVCEQYLKTGKVCDSESNIINKFKAIYSGRMNLPNWISFIKEEAEPSELESKGLPIEYNGFNSNEVIAELKTIIQRDQEIKDRLKVLFAEHSKALTEVIETNKRIETLIINL